LIPTRALGGAAKDSLNLLGRDLPLVVLLGLMAMLFWPSNDDETAGPESPPSAPPVPAGE